MKNSTTPIIRTYSELCQLETFDERFDYLNLSGIVGEYTFGFDRVFNQQFYLSTEWKICRNHIIARDNGCDLGVPGYEIYGQRIIIHHLNPISIDDIEQRTKYLLDPEFLICTTHQTHNAIHYGDASLISKLPPERTIHDTCPWKHN